ncbi:unnamed protein product [Blepharisma stoltei]|uniref:WWE domain-containing protein n=1 Tax=Blepharisma stoltei TaxID=1481888 RepID=A0AAU9JFZ7_9CILI|nr:unnamed protein product [Blepharisma stoltei]
MANRSYQTASLRNPSSRAGQNPPSTQFPRASQPTSYNKETEYSIPSAANQRKSDIGAQNNRPANTANPYQTALPSYQMQSLRPSSQREVYHPDNQGSQFTQEYDEVKHLASRLAGNKPFPLHNPHQIPLSIPKASPLLEPNLFENKNMPSQDNFKEQSSRPWTQANSSREKLGNEEMGNFSSKEVDNQQPAAQNPSSYMNIKSQGALMREKGIPSNFLPFTKNPMPGTSNQQITPQGIQPMVSPQPISANQHFIESYNDSSAANPIPEPDISIPVQSKAEKVFNPNLQPGGVQQLYRPNFQQKESNGPVSVLNGQSSELNPSISQPKAQQIVPKQQFSVMNAQPSGNNVQYIIPNRANGENNKPRLQGSIKQVVVSRESMPKFIEPNSINKPLPTPMNQQSSSPINQPFPSQINQPTSSPINQPFASQINQPISSPINQPITSQIDQPPSSQIGQAFLPPRSPPPYFQNNQPFSTPSNQPLSPPINQPFSTPSNQPLSPPINQPFSVSTTQVISPSNIQNFGSQINQPFSTPNSQPIKINPSFSGQNPQMSSINPPFSSSINLNQQSSAQNTQSGMNNPITSLPKPPSYVPAQNSPYEQSSLSNNPYSSPSPYQLQSSHEIANSNQIKQPQAPLFLPPAPSNPNQVPHFLPNNPLINKPPSGNPMSNQGFLPPNNGSAINPGFQTSGPMGNPGFQQPNNYKISNPGFQQPSSNPGFQQSGSNPGFQQSGSNPGFQQPSSNPGFQQPISNRMNFQPASSNSMSIQQPGSNPMGFQSANNNPMGFQSQKNAPMGNPGFSIPSNPSIPQNQAPSEQIQAVSKDIPCPIETFSKINPGSSLKTRLKQEYSVELFYGGSNIRIVGLPQNVELAAACISQRLEQLSSSRNIKWTFMKDDGKFEPYSDIICTVIENAYARGAKDVVIDIDRRKYKIIFGNPHRQVLPNSNISRTVRRNDGSEEEIVNKQLSENEVIWYWQDDNRRGWKPYTKEASRQIEAAYSNGEKKVLVQGLNVKAYLIDLVKYEQYNEQTRFNRKVRRGEP